MSCKGLSGKALMDCKTGQKATVTTASVNRVNNDKVKRRSHSTIESSNRISKKTVKGEKIKRKSYTLQDDGSLRIARNSSSNPKGSIRTIKNPNRATKRLNNQQNLFNKKAL
jgi:5-hydroxyisourate hydrolase-like protein (transthyretin family)